MSYLEHVRQQNTPEKIKARQDMYLRKLKRETERQREIQRLQEEAEQAKLDSWAKTPVNAKDVVRFIAACDDDTPDEWFGTDREITQDVMSRFFSWLQGENKCVD